MVKIQERHSNRRAFRSTRTRTVDQPTLRPCVGVSSHVIVISHASDHHTMLCINTNGQRRTFRLCHLKLDSQLDCNHALQIAYSSIHPILGSGSRRQLLLGPIPSCRLRMRGVEQRQLGHTEGTVRRSIPRILGMLLAVDVSAEEMRDGGTYGWSLILCRSW